MSYLNMSELEPSSLKLNDNKAGMKNLDKKKINEIILEASKGSKYYENEVKKNKELENQILSLKEKYNSLIENDILKGEKKANKLLEDISINRNLNQTFVHVDMDAYFAAVEINDNPSLRTKPMAVGSSSMLSTSNYVARTFGVRAGMPGFIAKKLCPDLILIEPNFDKYISISRVFRKIFLDYDINYCACGLDEATLDITEHLKNRLSYSDKQRTFSCNVSCDCPKPIQTNSKQARLFKACNGCGKLIGAQEKTFSITSWSAVEELRFRIFASTQLTSSAGIASNGLLAKIASDMHKPNGQYHLPSDPEDINNFITQLPIGKVPGIGKVSERKLAALDIVKCEDFYYKRGALYHLFKPFMFSYFMRISLGEGNQEFPDVETEENSSGIDRKSISVERTFPDCNDPILLMEKCKTLCKDLWTELCRLNLLGKCICIKLKLSTFEVRTRSFSNIEATNDLNIITNYACELLQIEISNDQPHKLCLRLLGVRISVLSMKLSPLVPSTQIKIKEAFQIQEMKVESTKIGAEIKLEEPMKEICNIGTNTKDITVQCPVCSVSMKMSIINKHLDICIAPPNSEQPSTSKYVSTLKRSAPVSSSSRPKVFLEKKNRFFEN